MKTSRLALLALAICVALMLPSCQTPSTGTFTNGTYHGTVGQTLVITGTAYTYTYSGTSFSGTYAINGSVVIFTTTSMNGTPTGLNQSTTFDVVSTTTSITLTNARSFVSGGCGMASDVFTM